MTRAVFLDRDGTLNRSFVRDGVPVPPGSVAQVEVLPGVPQALRRLKRAGFALVVVSNQPDVARGTATRQAVEEINQHLAEMLPLDAVLTCFHDDPDGCQCRKPAPGLVIDAAQRLGLQLSRSFVVGDRWRDIEAGRRAGCTTLLLRNDYSEEQRTQPDFVVDDLDQAASIILNNVEDGSP